MTIDKNTVLVGSDAEVAVFVRGGQPIPVTGMVGGTKSEPRPLGKLGAGFFIQEDNVNAEFNIPPCKTAKEFTAAIQKALKEVQRQLPPSFEIKAVAATEYDALLLQTPEAQAFGCEPDYNAYSMTENPKPRSKNPNLRTAAGHIHIGWDNPQKKDVIQLVKNLDLFCGLMYVGQDDKRRKELYGKAGAHRPKKYGVEYRVLGNSWLNNPADVFGYVMSAVDMLNAGIVLTPEEEKVVVEAINSDQISDAALRLLRTKQRAVSTYQNQLLAKEMATEFKAVRKNFSVTMGR